MPNAFERFADNHSAVYEEAEVSFDISARREIAQNDFGLEPLGVAMWWIGLPGQTGPFDPLSKEETKSLLQTVVRILATENILLPPNPRNLGSGPPTTECTSIEKQRIFPAYHWKGQDQVPYNLQAHRKLRRYVRAIARQLAAEERIQDVKPWLEELHWPLWNGLKGFRTLVPAGRRVNDQTPFGIRIDSIELRPIGDTVFRCSACGYVMGKVLLGVSYRCVQATDQAEATSIQSFFRRSARFAQPGSGYPDPYPLQTAEHTVAIERHEARTIER